MSWAPPWPDDRTEQLGLLIDGGASVDQAARSLRLKRGAVVGRAWRLGWSFGAVRTEAQRQRPFKIVRCAPPRAKRQRRDPSDGPVGMYAYLDRDTHEIIVARAAAEKVSRTQVIRELIEWGLEAVAAA